MSIENDVRLIGRLGDDPKTSYMQSGTAVTEIRLATSRKWKDRNGERQEETSWHRVKFFGKSAEIAGEHLEKGSHIAITGRIQYGEFEKDGVKRRTCDIIADQMQMLGGTKRDGDGRNSSAPRSTKEAPQRQTTPAKSSDFADDFHDDDIPF